MTLHVSLQHAFQGFSLDVSFTASGGVTALFGPSGAGKTSVINALAGLFHPDHGRIIHDDTVFLDTKSKINLPARKRQIGYVFQNHRLFPHMSVTQNLTYGCRAQGLAPDPAQFDQVVQMLGLEELLDRYPQGLSGGEKQRVAIGRALLSKPRMLLLDEPLAALDNARRQEILPYLERLRDHAGMPILFVSHSVSEVARLANTVVAMDRGKVLRAGPVAEVFADPSAAEALGVQSMGAILTAKVTAHHADGLTELSAAGGILWLPKVPAETNDQLRVRVRAQDVMLSLIRPTGISALNVLNGRITEIKRGAGPGVLVQMRCGADLLLARITDRSANAMSLKVGMPLYAVIKSVSVAQADIGSAG